MTFYEFINIGYGMPRCKAPEILSREAYLLVR